jgi:hypothetical protein
METETKPETLVLKQVAEITGVYTATVKGEKAIVIHAERNRAKAELRFNAVTLSEKRIIAGQKLAKLEGVPLYMALTVLVNKKIADTYLVPFALFKKHAYCEVDFALGVAAREAYANGGYVGIHFAIAKGAAPARDFPKVKAIGAVQRGVKATAAGKRQNAALVKEGK